MCLRTSFLSVATAFFVSLDMFYVSSEKFAMHREIFSVFCIKFHILFDKFCLFSFILVKAKVSLNKFQVLCLIDSLSLQ